MIKKYPADRALMIKKAADAGIFFFSHIQYNFITKWSHFIDKLRLSKEIKSIHERR